MSFRKKVINNKPKVALQSITTLIGGGYKTGKTRLWKELSELHYTSVDDTLLVAFEDGYETWEMENIVPVHTEGSDENLWKVWDFFKKEVVTGLVKEAKDGRIAKLIGIDTVDRAIDACTAWVIADRNKRYGKRFVSIQEITNNTDENGWTALYEELKKPFDSLKNAGYGLVYLAWTKEKETTLYNGKKYNSVELMMNSTAKKVFESQAHLICCLFNETTVYDKAGNELEENIKDKKGKEVASNFHETKTMMYFLPSEYVKIGGGRFTNLPQKIDYSAEGFLQVFENAVLGQLKKTTQSVEELKKEQEVEREEKLQEIVKEEETQNLAEDLLNQVESRINEMKNDQKVVAAANFKKAFGVNNYKQEKGNVENLQIALNIVNEILSK